MVKTRGASKIGVFFVHNVKYEAPLTSEFSQWAIIGGVVVEAYFKGIEPFKTSKMRILLDHNIVDIGTLHFR